MRVEEAGTTFTLRQATAQDAAAIRRLIRQVGINPLGLDWRRFTLAVSEDGQMLGCGQIKPHRDGSRELASIAVRPETQGQGIGKAIVTSLVAKFPLPIYLTCRSTLHTFYEPFGFRIAEPEEMPPYFHRVWQAFRVLRRFLPLNELLVMIKDT